MLEIGSDWDLDGPPKIEFATSFRISFGDGWGWPRCKYIRITERFKHTAMALAGPGNRDAPEGPVLPPLCTGTVLTCLGETLLSSPACPFVVFGAGFLWDWVFLHSPAASPALPG